MQLCSYKLSDRRTASMQDMKAEVEANTDPRQFWSQANIRQLLTFDVDLGPISLPSPDLASRETTKSLY